MQYKNSGEQQGAMKRLDLNAGQSFNIAQGQKIDLSLTLQLALDKNKDFLDEFTQDNRAFIEASYLFD